MTSQDHAIDTAAVWRITADYEVLQHAWGDSGVVYHAGTGDTHQVDLLTVTVLDLLREAPATLESLARRLARDQDIDDNPDLIERLAQVLRELRRLRIVETN